MDLGGIASECIVAFHNNSSREMWKGGGSSKCHIAIVTRCLPLIDQYNEIIPSCRCRLSQRRSLHVRGLLGLVPVCLIQLELELECDLAF